MSDGEPDPGRDLAALAAAAEGADAGLAAAVDGRVVAVTDRWCDVWGVDRDSVEGSPVEATGLAGGDGPPESGESVRFTRESDDDRQSEASRPIEAPDERTVEVTADTATVDGTAYLVYTARDVTDRVALERDSNVLDAIFENIPVYLFVKDEDARHIRVSATNEESEEYLGKTDVEIWGEDGREGYRDDRRVIEEGEEILEKEEYEPEWNQFFLTSKVPWRDESGEVRGLIGVTRNVTERERHRRQLERQNERLRTVASVISHDIRNPLQVAKGRLDLVRSEHDSDELDGVADALGRMETLLEDLLAMVQHGQLVEETDLVSIQDVATDAWATATDEAASLEFDQEFYFEADEDRLRQLLENLFRNAVVHGRPDVTVRIGPMEGWPGFYVADDGPGIPEDEREEVFESGYTTAEEGTGFGLAIVEVIAEAHGWDVRVTESEDGGARFEFVGVEFE